MTDGGSCPKYDTKCVLLGTVGNSEVLHPNVSSKCAEVTLETHLHLPPSRDQLLQRHRKKSSYFVFISTGNKYCGLRVFFFHFKRTHSNINVSGNTYLDPCSPLLRWSLMILTVCFGFFCAAKECRSKARCSSFVSGETKLEHRFRFWRNETAITRLDRGRQCAIC